MPRSRSPGPGGCLASTPSLVIRRRSFHDRFARCVRRRVIARFVQSARSPQSRMHRPDRRVWLLHRSGPLLGSASMRRREGLHSNVRESPSTSWNLICLCLSLGLCSRSSLAWPVAPVALRPAVALDALTPLRPYAVSPFDPGRPRLATHRAATQCACHPCCSSGNRIGSEAHRMELARGLEPITFGLQIRCSTS